MTARFPVDEILGDVRRQISVRGAVVVEAPPGAGKTTRLPPALLGEVPGRIVVLEPRRLAARLPAEHVASVRGERCGDVVGYTVRFDDRTSNRTRLRYVTSGTLLRQLTTDPTLREVGALVFDELHERHLPDDLLLAWAQRLRRGDRPDLRIVAMSATLDATPVADWLGATALRSEGRRFPVDLEHQTRRDDRPLVSQVVGAVKRAASEGPGGDILVFLPGVADIERCLRACANLPSDLGLLPLPLHGSLSPAQTRDTLRPRPGRRRVILATNIAESSLTIDGVTVVIDSGLHKVARSSPWSGLTALTTEPIPRDSAEQRAGRAGRTAPGRCWRLYSEADLAARPARLDPEARRVNLAPAVLTLATLGVRSPSDLDWLDRPDLARWEAASALLRDLGALNPAGRVTPLGERLAALPVHPRLGRLVLDGRDHGILGEAAHAAALISEDARLPDGLHARLSDLEALIDHARPSRRVQQVHRQLMQVAGGPGAGRADDPWDALRQAVLRGFPDRVARRRERDAQVYALAGGSEARLDPRSTVRDAEWVVAVEATGGARPLIRLASAIEPDWLLDLPGAEDDLADAIEVRWDDRAERVEAVETTRWRGLLLDSRSVPARDRPEATDLLRQRARAAGPGRFADAAALELLQARRCFAHEHDPELPALTDDDVLATLDALCDGSASFRDLKRADLLAHLEAQLTWPQRQRLDALAPTRVDLASGRWARVRYPKVGPPRISAPVQHFLGMAEGPTLAGGRVPALLELLAPNRRPVQLTDDLRGFWERTWPQVRKELRGRYPKHAWPEDPLR